MIRRLKRSLNLVTSMRDVRKYIVRTGSINSDAHKASEVATKEVEELLTTCTILLSTNNASSLPTSSCAVMLPTTNRVLNGSRLQE